MPSAYDSLDATFLKKAQELKEKNNLQSENLTPTKVRSKKSKTRRNDIDSETSLSPMKGE